MQYFIHKCLETALTVLKSHWATKIFLYYLQIVVVYLLNLSRFW